MKNFVLRRFGWTRLLVKGRPRKGHRQAICFVALLIDTWPGEKGIWPRSNIHQLAPGREEPRLGNLATFGFIEPTVYQISFMHYPFLVLIP